MEERLFIFFEFFVWKFKFLFFHHTKNFLPLFLYKSLPQLNENIISLNAEVSIQNMNRANNRPDSYIWKTTRPFVMNYRKLHWKIHEKMLNNLILSMISTIWTPTVVMCFLPTYTLTHTHTLTFTYHLIIFIALMLFIYPPPQKITTTRIQNNSASNNKTGTTTTPTRHMLSSCIDCETDSE